LPIFALSQSSIFKRVPPPKMGGDEEGVDAAVMLSATQPTDDPAL
jgi:hypothetical protein